MGVETNTYQIPDLVLSDTFYEWFTVTNNEIIEKLNLLTIYDVGSPVGDGISAGTDSSGSLFIEIADTINKDITFNGNITVNGSTTTINSTNFSVDDYNLILGATTENVSDEDIMNFSGNSAGGGIIINGSSGDKEFLWKYSNGAWNSNQNLALNNEAAILGSSDIRFGTGLSGGTATQGMIVGFTTGTTGGSTGSDTLIKSFNNKISGGHSADAIYINDDGYVSIVNGSNKITVNQTGHGFVFGNVLYMKSNGDYAKSIADNVVASEVVGVVSRVYSADRFEITTQGEIIGDFSAVTEESSDLSPGAAYFLSPLTAGKITGTKPVDNGQIQKTVLIGLASDRALVKNYLGGEVSLINQTTQALTSNKIIVSQAGHGFTYGDALYVTNSGSFDRAQGIPSDDTNNYNDVVGIVDDVHISGNTDTFSLVMSGQLSLAGGPDLTPGEVYYLNNNLTDNVRNITTTPSGSPGLVTKPVLVASGERTGIVTILRGQVNTAQEETELITDVPIGGVIAYHGSVGAIPDGYLLCNGESFLKSEYPDLYSSLLASGTDVEDDTDTDRFKVPDLTDKFIAGAGDRYNIADEDGQDEVILTVQQIPNHSHTVARTDTQDTDGTGTGFDQSPEQSGNTTNTSSTGGGQAHENRPPFYALAWIIRSKGLNALVDGTQILGGDREFIPTVQIERSVEAASNSSQTFTINLPEFEGSDGTFISTDLIRGVRVRFSSSNSGSRGNGYIRLPDGTDFLVHSAKATQAQSTDTVIPVNPGQGSVSFRLELTETTTGDLDSVTAIVYGVEQVLDNSLNRLRQSYTSRKNVLINGNFDLWQRGVALDGSPYTGTDDVYTADRWIRSLDLSSITGTPSIEQKAFSSFQTKIPHYPKYYVDISAPPSYTFPTNGHLSFEQRIEDVRTFANKNITISFWAKGTAEGQILLGYTRNFGGTTPQNDYFKIAYPTIGTAWRKYSYTVPVGSIPQSRTEGFDSNGFPNSYFALCFYLACKDDIRGNTEGDLQYTGTLSIAQVQVEQGARATEFEIRDTKEELALAQRYYQISQGGWNGNISNASTNYGNTSVFATPMRAIPTVDDAENLINTRFVTVTTGDILSTTLTENGFMTAKKPSSSPGQGTYSGKYHFGAEL